MRGRFARRSEAESGRKAAKQREAGFRASRVRSLGEIARRRKAPDYVESVDGWDGGKNAIFV